jgi:hypothetical protein
VVVRDYQAVFVRDCTANKDNPIPADVAEKGLVSRLAQAFCRMIESSELITELGR